MSIQTIRFNSDKVKQILGLTSFLVGVKFIFNETEMPSKIEKLSGHCHCEALIKARHSDHVLIDAVGIAWPAAAMRHTLPQTKQCLDFHSKTLNRL